MHSLILIEGIPGSGKTTAAERVCQQLRSLGVDARWFDELDPDHPATPRRLRKRHAEPGFAELCLESWRRYAAGRARSGELHVLESSAFQDTVRFMYADDRSRSAIRAFFEAFEHVVAGLSPRLVYLEPIDPAAHTREFVIPTRGPDWTRKLCDYVAGTPVARRRGWSGEAGMVAFWAEYAALCAELVDATLLPVSRYPLKGANWREAEQALEREMRRCFAAREPVAASRASYALVAK